MNTLSQPVTGPCAISESLSAIMNNYCSPVSSQDQQEEERSHNEPAIPFADDAVGDVTKTEADSPTKRKPTSVMSDFSPRKRNIKFKPLSPPSSIGSWGFITRIGDRPENQDTYFCPKPVRSQTYDGLPFVFGVLDGHGVRGGFAAKECARVLQKELIARSSRSIEGIDWAVKQSFDAAQNRLIQPTSTSSQSKSRRNEDNLDYGTTACVAIVYPFLLKICVGWCGDSRAYLMRRNVETQSVDVVEQTIDHAPSFEAERERVVASGGRILDRRGLRVTPGSGYTEAEMQRLQLGLCMTRALGHRILRNYGIIHTPECITFDFQSRDWLIIASDGLWNILAHHEVANFIKDCEEPQKCCSILMREAEKRAKTTNTKLDNTTIVIYVL